jgi:hypothetical protein
MPANSFETHLTPGSALAAIGLPALLSLGLDGSISNGTQLLEINTRAYRTASTARRLLDTL